VNSNKRNFFRPGRWAKAVILGCFLAGQALAPSGPYGTAEAAERPVVGTWMWNPYVIGEDPAGTLQALSERGVNLVYLCIDRDYPQAYYSRFIREAGALGIEVQALGGAPNWVLPEHNGKLYDFIYWVTGYNSQVAPEERFAGIHLDVEPYVLPEWSSDSDRIIGLWMDTVSGFAQEVRSTGALKVGIDMPVWLEHFSVRDGYGGRTTLSDWLIRRVDEVTLMAYRTSAKDVADSVRTELDEADRAGVPVIIGVDTADTGQLQESYYYHGTTRMNGDLARVAETYGSRPSYRGYSVHEWDSWIRLGPGS